MGSFRTGLFYLIRFQNPSHSITPAPIHCLVFFHSFRAYFRKWLRNFAISSESQKVLHFHISGAELNDFFPDIRQITNRPSLVKENSQRSHGNACDSSHVSLPLTKLNKTFS